MQYDRQITISAAGSRQATFWQTQTLYWSEMVDKLRTAVRHPEMLQEYLKLPKPQQDNLKDVGGFVGGELSGGRRKAHTVISRDLLTLDLDNIPSGGTDKVLKRLTELTCAFVTYSTRKHEPHRPRLRVIVPLSRAATPDEYEPLARKLAEIIDIELADPTTFEVNRLMFWPSCSSDSQYVYHFADAKFLDTDILLAHYTDWRNVHEWPQVPGAPDPRLKQAATQGDPTAKRGVIGAFCRQYDVPTAIDTFLSGLYVPTDTHDDRYTYIEGSTVGGAVLYDHGNFLYSHHATDPCSGKLVNAFDLVRLHKFGELDDEAKPGTPVNKLPSFVQMSAFALHDAGVADVIKQERYERAMEDFGADGMVAGDTVAHSTEATEGQGAKPDMSWTKRLKVHPQTAQPEKTIDNVMIALNGDPLLRGRVHMDTFADSLIGTAPLPWYPRNGEHGAFAWQDEDDSGLRRYIERVLNFKTKDTIEDALVQTALKNSFNPVTDYLGGLEWDGVKRLDTLFVDYLGALDTVYTRAVARKSFVGAISRVMRPGIKYDTMPVLTGDQGLGKSTLISKMGQAWFTDAITSFEGKEASELLQGIWLVEIGEMSAYNRSDLNIIKGFLTRTEDHYRASYGKRAQKHPRRCVFFGTSNRDDYLRDVTGGRRFWPVDVGLQQQIKKIFRDPKDPPGTIYLVDEVDQIWAEAMLYWRLGEPLVLTGEAAEEAERQQEGHREQDPREGLIRAFVERPVPIGWQKRDIRTRNLYWSSEVGKGGVQTEPRDRICAAEIWEECLGERTSRMRRSDTAAINDILGGLDGWIKNKDVGRYGPYGRIKGGYVRR